MRKIIHRITAGLMAFSVALFSGIIYLDQTFPEEYYVSSGETLTLSQSYLTTSYPSGQKTSAVYQNNGSQTVSLNLFGIFPVKNVSTKSTQAPSLIPSGSPFGVKMFTDGAIIIGFSEIDTENGKQCPSKKAGLKEGDIILSVNDQEISYNEQVAQIIESSDGKPVTVKVKREEKELSFTFTPILSKADGKYKSGIWVRDSAAGIGTITFIDPQTSVFAGLGHAICDVDTGQIMPVGSGEVCDVTINSIQKGTAGTPGELQGVFTTGEAVGKIATNNETGIFGMLFDSFSEADAIPMAFKQEVKTGPATILCGFEGGQPQEYEIEIVSVDYNENTETKNMVLRVVDEDLIALTGGIVQGMSGTPILQNGKLIGAVTHVFINDATKGYGIFAENMYDYAKDVEMSK